MDRRIWQLSRQSIQALVTLNVDCPTAAARILGLRLQPPWRTEPLVHFDSRRTAIRVVAVEDHAQRPREPDDKKIYLAP